MSQGGLGPVPNDLFTWWQVLLMVAFLITLVVIVVVAVSGFTIWIFRGHPPESRLVRTDMAFVGIGGMVGAWIVAAANVLGTNAGQGLWLWIWPGIIAGAIAFGAWVLRDRRTPHR